jgi:hypothetical protein
MTQDEAIRKIQDSCKEIALLFMKIHAVVPHLGDEDTQAISLKSLHQMTTDLEVVKKHLLILQKRDDSSEL